MARVSTKANKNIYQTTREGLKLTREAAGELLEVIAPERMLANGAIDKEKYLAYKESLQDEEG